MNENNGQPPMMTLKHIINGRSIYDHMNEVYQFIFVQRTLGRPNYKGGPTHTEWRHHCDKFGNHIEDAKKVASSMESENERLRTQVAELTKTLTKERRQNILVEEQLDEMDRLVNSVPYSIGATYETGRRD